MLNAIRRWARGHTEQRRYSPVGIAFHWIMAAVVMGQLALGWYAGRMASSFDKLGLYQLHTEIGFAILLLAGLRGVWRLLIPGPVNDADTPGFQANIAHITHILFYGLFIALPLSGWALWSALPNDLPLSIAGVVPVPDLPFAQLSPAWQRVIMEWAETIHQLSIIGLAVLIPAHVAAALKHHFWDRHDVLTGMLPDLNGPETPGVFGHGQEPRQAPQSPDRSTAVQSST
ncbi:cytochrome b [Qipengyuania sp.]|uniref:cytochrome b n=1 Tax=Qipengyuania sp. TaxID=2004515 RepID=UPI0037357D91